MAISQAQGLRGRLLLGAFRSGYGCDGRCDCQSKRDLLLVNGITENRMQYHLRRFAHRRFTLHSALIQVIPASVNLVSYGIASRQFEDEEAEKDYSRQDIRRSSPTLLRQVLDAMLTTWKTRALCSPHQTRSFYEGRP